MLRDHDAWNDLEEFAATQEGSGGQLTIADTPLRGGGGGADEIGGTTFYDERIEACG